MAEPTATAASSSSSGAPSTFDLHKQREALEELRREVEALDEAVEGAAPSAGASAIPCLALGELSAPEALRGQLQEDSASQRAVDEVSSARSPAPPSAPGAVRSKAALELEAQWKALATELTVAEANLSEQESSRTSAKTEWTRTLRRGAGSQARQEKLLAEAQSELNDLCAEEARQESSFKAEREKLQRRLRRFVGMPRPSLPAEVPPPRGMSKSKAATASGERSKSARAAPQTTSKAPMPKACASRSVGAGRRKLDGDAARAVGQRPGSTRGGLGVVSQLQQREQELCEAQEELQARQAELKRTAHLSDGELSRLRTRAELRSEESRVCEEQAELRAELKQVDGKANSTRRELMRLRNMQQLALKELAARNVAFKQQEATETEAMQLIDAYLATSGSPSNAEVQDRLAEWLEADICLRQVEHVKRALSAIVVDAGARAQVLEKALAELHEDLDRRAAVILELVERLRALRLSSIGGDDEAGEAAGTEAPVLDSSAELLAADEPQACGDTSGQLDEESADGGAARQQEADSRPTASTSGAKGGGSSSSSSLEVKAVEAELRNQRSLFEVRSEQVEVLEQRLATLLATEAPKAQALRQWIAAHEPFSEQRLQTCMAAAVGHTSLRADIEAMRSDKASEFVEAQAAREEERCRLVEVSTTTKEGAESAAASLMALQRRREQILTELDRLLKSEHSLIARSTTVNEAIERDRRRLIEQSAQQLRAAAKTNPPVGGPKAVRTATEVAKEAKSIVEAARSQQVAELDVVAKELSQVLAELTQVQTSLLDHEQQQNGKKAGNKAATVTTARKEAAAQPKAAPVTATAKRPQSAEGAGATGEARKEAIVDELTSRLTELDRHFEEAASEGQEKRALAARRVEELQAALQNEQAKQRTASSGVLKEYRRAQTAVLEAEHRRDAIKANLMTVQTQLLLLPSAQPGKK
mmetsp:Transcript_76077/g.181048  ORF Transcript_76077/g.181048 Transcript_76077/m.181048 type:complete len:939 (-) Transcript_76077:47-2863(-)